MEWIFDNWYIVVGFAAAIVVAVSLIVGFFGMPNDKQKAKVKEWLIWACIEAEKALQSGTGQLKLREVWNKFVSIPSFSFISKIITFDQFEIWVQDALKIAKNMIVSNFALAEYVYGNKAEEQIEILKVQLAKEGEEDVKFH